MPWLATGWVAPFSEDNSYINASENIEYESYSPFNSESHCFDQMRSSAPKKVQIESRITFFSKFFWENGKAKCDSELNENNFRI